MTSGNIDALLENQSLKNEFAMRNLDLSQVFFPIPDNLERENRILRRLLDWVQRYSECGDRRKMEAEGYDYPPIEPALSPENDWYLFKRWMSGKPIRKKIREQLYPRFVAKRPERMSDEEIAAEIRKLTERLADIRIIVEFKEDIPPRLVYMHLLEVLDEQWEMINEGFWHLDGCTGYCPGCFQRPWCEFGCQSCWTEDEEAGKMCLDDSLNEYVSPSPVSLLILRKCQAEEDKKFEAFKKTQKDTDSSIDTIPFNSGDEDDVPF